MEKNGFRYFVLYPIILALVLCGGIYIGQRIGFNSGMQRGFLSVYKNKPGNKIQDVLNYIEQEYVDSVSADDLSNDAIVALLENLDPHSAYIPAKDLSGVNESLEGNFDGIGIEFNILQDTIIVVTAVSGGPSEALGIRSGDRIIKVEGKSVAGIKITNEDVLKKLRGVKGTKVRVAILRRGVKDPIDFTITRDKIPLYSVDVSYIAAPQIGYIKISRFGAQTYEEYLSAFEKLKAKGMQKLILDLRGNPGGYLQAATKIADEFLENGKLIVYTEGRARKKETFIAGKKGAFEKEALVVLIDEGSASASEIIAGAIQDNDRGLIIGRRTFGKGLVQEQSEFNDGSALRLTIARYYTPTGRCIQKPYVKGRQEEYYEEEMHRFSKGELVSADSIKFSDSLKYTTPKGKVVYGGGGIMPDVFIPIDTNGRSLFLTELVYKGLFNQFAIQYTEKHRSELKRYTTADQFKTDFNPKEALVNELVQFAKENKITRKTDLNEAAKQTAYLQTKALIARILFKNEGFYPILHQDDKMMKEAIKQLTTITR